MFGRELREEHDVLQAFVPMPGGHDETVIQDVAEIERPQTRIVDGIVPCLGLIAPGLQIGAPGVDQAFAELSAPDLRRLALGRQNAFEGRAAAKRRRFFSDLN